MLKGAIEIRYLTRSAIDLNKWDRCIKEAPNGLIYHFSWYLDAVCTWDALVAGDYAYVLPLPWKKKLWVRYIYIPPFVAQTGIISKYTVDGALVKQFLQKIPAGFSVADITLNELNPSPDDVSIKQKLCLNMVLPLNEPYEQIAARFSKDGKKNIRQAEQSGITITDNIPVIVIMDMYRAAYGHKNKAIQHQGRLFTHLSSLIIQRGYGFTTGVKSGSGQLVAAAFIAKDDKRIYYLLAAPNENGRKTGAIHFLINHLIRSYAGTDLFFDFEGSDIPSVAQFYKKFNPVENIYFRLRINRLPYWLRWLK